MAPFSVRESEVRQMISYSREIPLKYDVDVFVAGNAVFSAEDMAERVREFQRILK